MKIIIRGDKMDITKSIKDYVKEKLSKLDKYFEKEKDIEAVVITRVKNKKQTVEVTIPTKKYTIRAEESHDDLYAAIDLIIDKLERLIRKNKTKLQKQYSEVVVEDYSEKIEEKELIVKRKNVVTKPMSEEEAILQMNLLGHDFFAFKNIDEECVSVLYYRKDKTIGIINIK